MKKLILSIFLFLAILSPVYATGSYEYAKDFNTPLNLYFRDCSGSSTTCETSVSAVRLTGTFEDGLSQSYFQTGSNVELGANYGINVILANDTTLLKDYLYSLTFSTCNTGAKYDYNNLLWLLGAGNSVSSAGNYTSRPEVISMNNDILSDYPFSTNIPFSKCFMHTVNFVPVENVNYLGLGIRSSTNNTTKLNFIGYKIQNLGDTKKLTAEEVETIITNNNQIIQNQINDINSNIADVENNLNQNIQDTEDRLNQSIVDSNQATQDTINNNFNDCHTSYNLFNGQFKHVGLNIIKDDTIGTVASLPNLLSSVVTPVTPGKIYSVSRNQITPRFTIGFSNALTNGSESYTLTSSTSNKIENIVAPEGYSYMIIYLSNSLIDTSNLEIMVNEGSTSLPYEPYGEEICSNRLDNVTGSIDNVNDSLNNSNTSDAENDASNFFNNFTDSDNGGLSGIITSPLIAINKMLDSQCSPLTTTYKNKTISLSCGNEFWAKATGIKEFLNLVEGGLLCYLIIRKLYLLVQDLKNPDNDRVEVMKL